MVYVDTFRPDVQRVLHRLLTQRGPIALAMLYKRNDSPQSGWNFIFAAPWTDMTGRARATDLLTRALSEELGYENKPLVSRITVLPTKDQFVREITSMYQVASPGAEQAVTNISAAGIPIGVGWILYSQAP
jgi:hypothetical protein